MGGTKDLCMVCLHVNLQFEPNGCRAHHAADSVVQKCNLHKLIRETYSEILLFSYTYHVRTRKKYADFSERRSYKLFDCYGT